MGELTLVVPKEYGYVILDLGLYVLLNIWMASRVFRARIMYKVAYPAMYASESENKDAKLFNCVQRAHQNSVEWMPVFFLLMILGGFRHPCVCAALGLFYIVTRFFYFKGYSTGKPGKRITPVRSGFVALIGLLICTFSSGISLLLA